MPSYNGQSMAPLEVTDNPTPKYLQIKYQFPCGAVQTLEFLTVINMKNSFL
jgi:hypothetical protein